MRKILAIMIALTMVLTLAIPAIGSSGEAVAIDKKAYDVFGVEFSANNKVTAVADYVTLRTSANAGWFVEVCDDFIGTVAIAYKIGSAYMKEVIYFDGTNPVYRFGDGSGKNGINSVRFGKVVIMNPAADTVLMKGVVQTMDADRSFATAVAILDGKILFVGSDLCVKKYIGDETEVRDLGGQMVLPGFLDTHMHAPGMYASNVPSLFYVEPTLDVLFEYVQQFIYDNPNANGYWFNHLNTSAFAGYKNGFPDAEWLDGFDVGERADGIGKPIFMQDISWHSWVVNSAAMERANIVRPGDISQNMQRTSSFYAHLDEDGWPTGYFVDGITTGLTGVRDGSGRGASAIPGIRNNAGTQLTVDVTYNTQGLFTNAWQSYQIEAHSYGITGVADASGNWYRVENEFRDWVRNGTLTLRVNIPSFIDHETSANHTRTPATLVNTAMTGGDAWSYGIERKFNFVYNFTNNPFVNNQGYASYMSDWVSANTVKLYIDGVTEGGTAYLLEPYAPEAGLFEQIADPNYRGYSMWGDQKTKDMIALIDARGYGTHLHCLGDAAVKLAVEAIVEAQDANGTKGVTRHIITHVPYVDVSDYDAIAEYGIIMSIQPIWMFENPWFSAASAKVMGPERDDRVYPIKDMYDRGIIMTGSSDYDVSLDFRPLAGIEVGMTRTSPYSDELMRVPYALKTAASFKDDWVSPASLFGSQDDPATTRNAHQGVGLMAMLEMYTINGAYQMGMEDKIGSLEVGKFADLIILEKDLFKVEPKWISEVEVKATMVNGKFVFED